MNILEKLQDIYWDLIPYDYRPKQLWYQLKGFWWNRYTTVKPRTLNFHTWCDRDVLLAHTMFEILSRFLEEECSLGHIQWYGENGHKIIPGFYYEPGDEKDPQAVYVRDEMQMLYDWWHKDYLVNYDKCYDKWHEYISDYDTNDLNTFLNRKIDETEKQIVKDAREKEAKYDRDLIENMQRLCAISPYMWT